MCGIVGYTGNKNVLPILMEGLKMLEYRGYDSAGVAFFNNGIINTVKAKGKISNLEERLLAYQLGEANCGIGHTRWATHGAPSDVNSHPHSTEALSLVHNGIIENHAEIASMLQKEGYSFVSETDTERAAKLIDMLYKRSGDPKKALIEAKKHLLGSYAFAVVFKDIPRTIFAVRRDSPLIVCKNDSAAFLASDIPAILTHSKEYCRLDEGVIAELSPASVKFYDDSLNSIEQKFEIAMWNYEQAKKGGFPHFMIKEIHEEPEALRKTVSLRVKNDLPFFDEDLPSDDVLKEIDTIHIVACGTAMHAGLMGKHIIEKLARIPVNVEIASEFRYRDPILRKNSLVVLLSQSGETADTVAALRHAKEKGIPTLSIVNVFGSTLARESDYTIYTMAGPEISVASTKAYSVQTAMLYLIAIRLALIGRQISEEKAKSICAKLEHELPAAITATLALSDSIKNEAKRFTSAEHVFYIGRGIDYPLCVEASLKLKEISYIHSEAYAAGELKHGTISLITDGVPVIALMTEEAVAQKSLSGIHEVFTRGAELLVFCSEQIAKTISLPDATTITLPSSDEVLLPFVAACAMQLLAYHTSAQKGIDVDKPRNLAKSVTVE